MQRSQGLLNPTLLDTILITHMHGDHVLGLHGLLTGLAAYRRQMHRSIMEEESTRERKQDAKRGGPENKLTLAGPEGLHDYITASLKATHTKMGDLNCEVIELVSEERLPSVPEARHYPGFKRSLLTPTDGIWTVQAGPAVPDPSLFETDERAFHREYLRYTRARTLSIQASLVNHVDHMDSFAYSLTEPAPAPRINPVRAAAFGVRPGKKYNVLKALGGVMSDDGSGRVVEGADVCLDAPRGRKVTFFGDLKSPRGASIRMARGSDLVVHEATLADSERRTAVRRGHSTPVMAVKVADACGAETVVMNHFSNRYSSKNSLGVTSALNHRDADFELEKINRERRKEGVKEDLKMVWAMDLLELNMRKPSVAWVEHEDNEGREYMEELKWKEEDEREWLEELGEAVAGKFGWKLNKNGTMRRLTDRDKAEYVQKINEVRMLAKARRAPFIASSFLNLPLTRRFARRRWKRRGTIGTGIPTSTGSARAAESKICSGGRRAGGAG